ncbi:glycoside hydrolase family 31 protein [Phenylobacterium aquaticum]|uniref:glycoside hydrolase family 31 protein n=1 Tax=Phenylobacterium aquaticum TaxID=1763816 RepID=UPI0026ED5CAB|nr:glycoside hydrolase family 31 protein [Phenylobacterium aquaticum]
MRPSIANPPLFRLAGRDGARVTLSTEAGFTVEVFVLEPDIIRVLHRPKTSQGAMKTWAIAPGMEDVPDQGRDRMAQDGFACPAFDLKVVDDTTLVITTERLRLTVRLKGLFFLWEMADGAGGWTCVARDRATQAYNLGWWGDQVRHYLERNSAERYFGLGEKTGAMDRAGRRFRMGNVDAMGYDARSSDPLYKHIPFYITHNEGTGLAFGLFYDTYADCSFDFGAERSNYHGLYRGFAAESGDLDYYVIAGPKVADVTRRFTWLTGRPALMPRWALGYSGSTMSYTDAPDAQARMAEFIANCREHDILCDSFHLSSGYTSIGPRRYVFHWNLDKFPDPAGFARSYHEAGIRLCANIKPCLLDDHPLFEEALTQGLMILDAQGEPAWCQFWDGVGAYLDFTNPATQTWWRAHVTADLLAVGIDATWNDNNEFEVTSPDALAHMFGAPAPAAETKPLQTLLMLRASRQAQTAHAPERRPFLVSRAGAAGMQRYVQTWSGDNATAWESLQYNIRMGLGLALSGVSNSGHDIGGFSGPRPDAELFVRWVEAGVFMPRFSIHSWNDDGSANEPWMHPEATASVRDLIRLRYQLTPYLYDLTWRHHDAFAPIVRPTFHDFPDDPGCLADCDDLMLGPDLLVATVIAPGQTERELRTPAGVDWRDFWTGRRHPGGETITLPAPWGRPPLLVRDGSAIPLNIAEQSFDRRGDVRAFAIFAPVDGAFTATCYEDDGESEAWRTGGFGQWILSVEASPDSLRIDARATGQRPPTGALALLLRPDDARPVTSARGRLVSDRLADGWRRLDLEL